MAPTSRDRIDPLDLPRLLALSAGTWALFATLNASQVYLSMLSHEHSFPRLLAYNLAVWWAWALMTPAVLRLGMNVPLHPLRRSLPVHLLAASSTILIHLTAWAALTAWIEPYDVRNPAGFAESFGLGLWLRVQLEMVIYASLVALGTALAARRRLRRREREAARLEVKLAEAKLHALELQLRPHFLFNTLNTVTAMVRAGEDERAVETIVGLGDLLRATLETERTPRIPLHREMALLRTYLGLERLRFADRLEVSVEVAAEARSAAVPPFVLQPLAENAVRHGIAACTGPAVLRVTARCAGDRLQIDLFNSGPPLATEAEGVGLRNTRERLRQLYGGGAHLRVEDAPGGVNAHLVLPFETEPSR